MEDKYIITVKGINEINNINLYSFENKKKKIFNSFTRMTIGKTFKTKQELKKYIDLFLVSNKILTYSIADVILKGNVKSKDFSKHINNCDAVSFELVESFIQLTVVELNLICNLFKHQ